MVAPDSCTLHCPAAPWRVIGSTTPKIASAATAAKPPPVRSLHPLHSSRFGPALQHLPLAARPTPVAFSSGAAWLAYARASAAYCAGPAAALLLALLLLLAFPTWRLARCCCRGRRRRERAGKDKAARAEAAGRILRGAAAKCLKAALLVCSATALGGAIYGLTRVPASVVDSAVVVVDAAEVVAAGVLDAGDGLVDALQSMDGATQGLGQQLEAAAAGEASLQAPAGELVTRLDGVRDSMAGAASSLAPALLGLRPALQGGLERAKSDYLPLARAGETL